MPKHLRVHRQQLQAFLLGLGQQQAVKRITLDAAGEAEGPPQGGCAQRQLDEALFSSVTTWWGFSFTFEAPMPSFRESSQMLAVL